MFEITEKLSSIVIEIHLNKSNKLRLNYPNKSSYNNDDLLNLFRLINRKIMETGTNAKRKVKN